MIAREHRVRVDLGDARSYDVVIGGDAVGAVQALGARTYAVLFDRAVAPLAQRIIDALGKRAIMPAMMINEIPLPTQRSVICSPIHIRNIVPAVTVSTVITSNPIPGL